MLPVPPGTNISTNIGFLPGITLDIFCDTAGVNALAATVLAFARKPVFHLYVSIDDDLAGRSPSARAMGHASFMKYLVTMVLAYCAMVFTVEAFQFFNFRLLVLRILASTAYSFILLYALDCATLLRAGTPRYAGINFSCTSLLAIYSISFQAASFCLDLAAIA